MPKIGEPAPDFTAHTHTGEQVHLADLRGRIVVLFFYPMDGTAVCTAEACAFRDSYEAFVSAGAVVIGISGDSLTSHQGFAQKHQLPFLLLSDGDRQLRKAYGVSNTLGLIPKRVTFVIDQEGIVRHVFSALLMADKHVTEALEVVNRLATK